MLTGDNFYEQFTAANVKPFNSKDDNFAAITKVVTNALLVKIEPLDDSSESNTGSINNQYV